MRSPVASLVLLAVLASSDAGHAAAAGTRTPGAASFDSGRAFEHIRQLVAIGPRPPGSPGAQQARGYIAAQVKALGLAAVEQPFVAATPLGPVNMVNVTVRLPGRSPDRIIIGGHYDTKLFRQFRFVGANDGGSSTAMLLELARALKDRPRAFTIDLVFFDGEEALVSWSGSDHTYGSRYYVQQAQKDGSIKNVRAMVLVDMVGDRNLALRRESRSTKWLVDTIWASAERLGYGANFLDEREAIEDDHVSFLTAGVPAVDLIDLQYSAWHTANDTLDYVSARSLQIVGDVVLDALPAIEATLAGEKRP